MKLLTSSKVYASEPTPGKSMALRRIFFPFLTVLTLAFLQSGRIVAQEPGEMASQAEPFSESNARRARRTESVRNPGEILRSARYIYVRSQSALVAAEDIENKLRKHLKFQRLGLLITRKEMDADLILEVRRSVLTKFVFTAVEPVTLVVVASGKLSSLGGTVDGKVAKLFMKQIVAARGG